LGPVENEKERNRRDQFLRRRRMEAAKKGEASEESKSRRGEIEEAGGSSRRGTGEAALGEGQFRSGRRRRSQLTDDDG
jgi:hypothetical protein